MRKDVREFIDKERAAGRTFGEITEAFREKGYRKKSIQDITIRYWLGKVPWKKIIFFTLLGLVLAGVVYLFFLYYFIGKYNVGIGPANEFLTGDKGYECLAHEQCDDGDPTTVDLCRIGNTFTCDYFRNVSSRFDMECQALHKGTYEGGKIAFVYIADGFTENHSYDSERQHGGSWGFEWDQGEPGTPMDRWIGLFDKGMEYEIDSEGVGTFGLEPFKTYKERFDVYTLRSTELLNCNNDDVSGRGSSTCDYWFFRALAMEKCGITNEPVFVGVVSATKYLGSASISSGNTVMMGPSHTHASHELAGHAFGGLRDEYFHPNRIADQIMNPSIKWPNEDRIFENVQESIDTNTPVYGDSLERPSYGCPDWCSGELNTESLCYPIHVTFHNCIQSTRFEECWHEAHRRYYDETGKSFGEDCNLGKDCREGTDCYATGAWNFRTEAANVMIWHWFGEAYIMPDPDEYVIYTEKKAVPEEYKYDIVTDTHFPYGGGWWPNEHEHITEQDNIWDYAWWTAQWEHLDVEGCPKWCAGLDTESGCYDYYSRFKSCAAALYEDEENRVGYNNGEYVEATSCWEPLATEYKAEFGVSLADGCVIGKDCTDDAECVWPGGGSFDPYGTFRKNNEMPYWGYGKINEEHLERRILGLTE